MEFEQALTSELRSISGLSNKVFPIAAPDGSVPPFVVYYKATGGMVKTLSGTTKMRNGMYEIDILAKTYAELQTLFQAVKAKVLSFAGRTVGGSNILMQDVTIENFIELYEGEVKWYRINFELRFYFNEE